MPPDEFYEAIKSDGAAVASFATRRPGRSSAMKVLRDVAARFAEDL
jgi:hypothetical protein